MSYQSLLQSRVLIVLFSIFLTCQAKSLKAQQCNATPFACDVDVAIDVALQYSRTQENNLGFIQDAQHNFLVILSFIEKRAVTGLGNGRVIGYQGLDPLDQQLVNRLVTNAITSETGLNQPNQPPYVYSTGGSLMALSAYLGSGGIDDLGLGLTVTDAIANGVLALQNVQGSANFVDNNGGWNYYDAEFSGDLSTTQFAVAGLSAASNLIDGAADVVPNVVNFLQVTQSRINNGGLSYRPADANFPDPSQASSSMTASGLWCYRLSDVPASDIGPQQALSWLSQNYTYDRMIGPFSEQSTFYYMWAAEKALSVSGNDGLGAPLYAESFGQKNPAQLGYPQEPPSAYFDYATTLLDWQDQLGAWGRGLMGPTGWSEPSSHHFAILTLERSLGGVCIDEDQDALCGTDDNCPEVPNEDQLDEDMDGVGDVCDNCPKIPNRAQTDADADLRGDACDRYLCVPDGAGEICDGLDNDCDGFTDRNLDGSDILAPESCSTGLSGVCGLGHFECASGGRIICRANDGVSLETCDLIDNDCDGNIDEGLINACGRCGPLPRERCDGVDNNCDGIIDEGENLCFGDQVCSRLFGLCADTCSQASDCEDGKTCKQGFCVSLCDITRCGEGATCDPETGRCIDLCENVICGEGDVCLNGNCVANNCYATGCGSNETCQDGQCIPDPCLGISCGSDAFCRNGNCVFSCAQISCSFGETCIDGDCVSNQCGGVVCEIGQVCIDQVCQADTCQADTCALGQTCISGSCAQDPCWDIECPNQQKCQVVRGSAQCVADWLADPNELYDMGMMADLQVIDMEATQDMQVDQDQGMAADMYANRCEKNFDICKTTANGNALILDACQAQKDSCLETLNPPKKKADGGCQKQSKSLELLLLLCLLGVIRLKRSFKRLVE